MQGHLQVPVKHLAIVKIFRVYSECDSFSTFLSDENSFMPGKSVDKPVLLKLDAYHTFTATAYHFHCLPEDLPLKMSVVHVKYMYLLS